MSLYHKTRSLCLPLRSTRLCHRRFIPPWERDGKSADAFFSGLMQSSNPMQSERREAGRAEAEVTTDALSPAEQNRLDQMRAHNAAIAARRREFVPYGATPRVYFARTQMAAFGEYAAMLHAEDGHSTRLSYSNAARDMLREDLEQKIPYRYDTLVAPRGLHGEWPLHGTAGLVLDIDGVVYRSHQLIDGADVAIRRAVELRLPLLFMTNGGGMSEAAKASQLSALVGCEILPSQVLLAHTPMQLLVPSFREKNVLIVGSPHCAEVARDYGFRRAISVQQFQAEHPEMVPYKKWGEWQRCEPGTVPFPEIDAILQFNDPEDVFSDVQTILDVLLAPKGRVGRFVSTTQCVSYYVAADDLLWATEAPLPRLGQGAFREMISAVFESVTGHGLHVTFFGKPRTIAYAFAEQRMEEESARLGWDPKALRSIFMVGDNVDTDILGANARGGRWTSVHVLSGVGTAPAARRTLAEGDEEMEWIESSVDKTPHYVAPTLDHFLRELLAFPETALLQHKRPYYGMPNPVNLKEMYGLSTELK